MKLNCYPTSTGVMGKMPNGAWRLFATESDYFDAYYDAWYELNNFYELDLPEVA